MWYCTAVCTDLAGAVHTITPKSAGSGVALAVGLAHNEADSFMFTVEDYSATIRAWLERGCLVDIFIGTAASPTVKAFHGMVEEVSETWDLPEVVMVQATGRDVFSIILDRRATQTYLDTEISAIVRDLMSKYAPYPLSTMLALSFYEGAGTTAHDESQHKNDATLTNATWSAAGRYGAALSLDGTGDYAATPSITLTSPFTISAWIKPTSDNTMPVIIGNCNIAAASNGFNFFHDQATGFLAFRCGDGTAGETVMSDSAVGYGAWVHVAIVVTNGASVKFYIDGELNCTETLTKTFGVTGALYIGQSKDADATSMYSGLIDEVRIDCVAKTALDVKSYCEQAYLHDIDATTEAPDDIRFPYRPLKECLDTLAGLAAFDYRGNPNDVIAFKEAVSEATGITYDSTDLAPGAEKLTSLYPIKNRVYVLGGDYMEVDHEQATIGATAENSKDYYFAGSFTPARSSISQISLYLKRTGNPADLTGAIYTDSSGPAAKIASFTVDSDFVGTSAGWVPIAVSADTLIGQKYWVSIDKIGDASNYYEWYDDDGVAGENAYDADGAGAWTVQASSYAMAFKTHYSVPVIAVKQDYASAGDFMWREVVHEDRAITSRVVARDLAQALLDELSDETPSLKTLNTYNQTIIPDRGKLVTVDLPHLGIDSTAYETQSAVFEFKAGELGTPFMQVQLGKSAEELSEWLHNLRMDVDRAKIRDTGVSGGLVNTIQAIAAETVTAGAALTTTTVLSGAFEIDTARIDFSDVG